MRKIVLGAPVDVLSSQEILDRISLWIGSDNRMKLVVTAYSEFYVQATRDTGFMKVMQEAELVTPDGVSVLAAVKYLEKIKGKGEVVKLVEGLRVGGEILGHGVGEVVTGVWLFENLTKMAAKRGWKIFLLGGWGNVGSRVVKKLLKRFPELKVAYDSGEERVGTDTKRNKEVIKKINTFKPDILFVAYNPVKQEKWLAKHRQELRVKVGIGVGGTFNEYMGEFKKAPAWMEKSGLKWLWRAMVEPKRIRRILRAVFVFPWLVYRSK